MEKREKSRKAQANVIALVLIILIVLVSILIVWNIVNPLLSEKSKEAEAGQSLLTVSLEAKEAILFPTGSSKVTVSRSAGEGKINSLKFIFYDEQGNSRVETREENLPGELETRAYSFSPFTTGFGKIKSVSVVPVLGKKIGLESKAKVRGVLEVPKGLVSWWRFNKSLDDYIGSNNCNLEGESYNCGNDSSLSVSSQFGISFWVKTDAVEGRIIEKGDNYKVYLDNGKIKFSSGLQYGVSDFSVNDEVWHHVVISIVSGGVSNIYIDNQLKTISISGSLNTNEAALIIGRNIEIGELMFFNEPLYHTEVEGLYNYQKNNFS